MIRPDPSEAEAFLAAHPDVLQFEAFITDPSGVQRGKILRPEELIGAFRHGRPLPCSILSLDITGADVEETGLVWDEGDSDRDCMPVAGTLTAAPWLPVPTAQMILTSFEKDGSPSIADPRHAVARVVDALAARGLYPVVAIELEFYLVDREAMLEGRPRPPKGKGGFRQEQLQAYLLQDLEDFSPFLDDVYAGAKAMGLPARTLISEYAPGQLEIVLGHRTDALRAADDAILYKRLVKGVAEKHGYVATFMAKPYADYSGSGMHVHASLADDDGANLFAGEGDANALLKQAIGGLNATMAESMAMFAPNANSYRRFRPNSYAPVGPAWAIDNRSVPVRVTAGPPASRHLEQRVCGADANPYVALATVLAGMLEGIERGIDPGPPITGNGYEQIAPSLPTTWHAALAAARASRFLPERLGADFVAHYLAIKEAECARFFAEIPDLDYALYLRLA
ncbi:glutamine synthetase family protein [Kaistia geumhonensis]|uniref:Glutamine synthetase n=1 Tax=Kaistia geumhonensis TaxID=410839 RepID=A0ABU0M3Y8_9HYPH|nr:glutamine synthetase family protein [Kaistia geumhonensis]MCX5479124.1 glutamine synthetase family protein [Kaistia geumhonensis]MDQ0515656.1 glutamine synthetase [Kaistia geumhonensis]